MDATQVMAGTTQKIANRAQGIMKMDATQVMKEANRIIEDFSLEKYAIYTVLFLVEIALCFWIAVKLIKLA